MHKALQGMEDKAVDLYEVCNIKWKFGEEFNLKCSSPFKTFKNLYSKHDYIP